MKSIGGKIYSVLVILSIVFALVLLQNQSSLNDIDSNNTTMNVYMQMQEAKSKASTAFQQIQLYSNLTYFKKDKSDEKDLMIEKLGTATEDKYDEIIKVKQANINTITASEIDSADKASLIGMGFFVVVLVLAVVVVNTMMAKTAKVAGKTLGILVEKITNNEGDLTERIAVKSKDEIGQMAIGINGFMEQLQLIMQKLKAESENMMISAEKV